MHGTLLAMNGFWEKLCKETRMLNHPCSNYWNSQNSNTVNARSCGISGSFDCHIMTLTTAAEINMTTTNT